MPLLIARISAETLKPAWSTTLPEAVHSIAVSERQGRMAVGLEDGSLVFLSSAGGDLLSSAKAHEMGFLSLAVSPDRFATSGPDGKVRLWDETGRPMEAIEAGGPWVQKVLWSPEGSKLLIAVGKRVRLWERGKGWTRNFAPQAGTVADLQWRGDGQRFLSAAHGGVWLFSVADEQPEKKFDWKGSPVCVAQSPDGQLIATGEQDATVHLYIVPTGEDLRMTGYESKVRALAWDPSGRALATSGGSAITVWDCSGDGPEGSEPARLEGHGGLVTALFFSVDGRRLVSGGRDGLVIEWDVETGEAIHKTMTDGEVSVLRALGSAGQFAVGTKAGTVSLLEAGRR